MFGCKIFVQEWFSLYIHFKVFREGILSFEKNHWLYNKEVYLDIGNTRTVVCSLTKIKYYTKHVSKCRFLFDKKACQRCQTTVFWVQRGTVKPWICAWAFFSWYHQRVWSLIPVKQEVSMLHRIKGWTGIQERDALFLLLLVRCHVTYEGHVGWDSPTFCPSIWY